MSIYFPILSDYLIFSPSEESIAEEQSLNYLYFNSWLLTFL